MWKGLGGSEQWLPLGDGMMGDFYFLQLAFFLPKFLTIDKKHILKIH